MTLCVSQRLSLTGFPSLPHPTPGKIWGPRFNTLCPDHWFPGPTPCCWPQARLGRARAPLLDPATRCFWDIAELLHQCCVSFGSPATPGARAHCRYAGSFHSISSPLSTVTGFSLPYAGVFIDHLSLTRDDSESWR